MIVIEEIIDDIEKYIKYIITDEMSSIFRETSYFFTEYYNEASYCIPCQMLYIKESNKLYLYYELDKYMRYVLNSDKCAFRINSRLLINFYKDFNINLEIVGPWSQIKPRSVGSRVASQSSYVLGLYTFTYWRCFDGTFRFIEDEEQFILNNNVFFKPFNQPQLDQINAEKYSKKIFDINQKYDFVLNNEIDVPKAFNEYAEVCKQFYGKELGYRNDTYFFYICSRYEEK